MRKSYLGAAAAAGLLLALSVSAEAAGRTPGAAITSPPGWQGPNATGQSSAGWTNSTPPGWNGPNATGQTNGWQGSVPPGWNSPPGR